jgi:microcystin-dependent protein
MGTGSAITYQLAEMAGTEQETLSVQQLPAHSHPVLAAAGNQVLIPSDTASLAAGTGGPQGLELYVPAADLVGLNPAAVGVAGGSQPHENTQPFLCINFIISLFGIFPSQT